MRNMIKVCALVLIAFVSSPTDAQIGQVTFSGGPDRRLSPPSQTIQQFYETCKKTEDGSNNFADNNYCKGYISGIADYLQQVGPNYNSYEAAVQAFMNWAVKNRDLWQNQSVDGVIASLQEQWPCTAKKPN